MASNNSSGNESAGTDAPATHIRSDIVAFAKQVTDQDDPLDPPAPVDERRWWQRLGFAGEKGQPKQADERPLTRLCNAVLVLALEQGTPEVVIRRSAGVLRIGFRGGAVAEQELALPGFLYEKVAARYRVMARSGAFEDGPFSGNIALRYNENDYNVAVSITPEAQGPLLSMRLAPGRHGAA